MKRWHFQASPLAIIVIAAMCVLMIALGFWQIRRGHDKQRLLQVYASLAAQPALPFDPRLAATDRVIHVQTRGIYDAQRQLLLDNQPSHDRAG
ncbi:MAG: SURF1 family cytochrome oxidase biogenesis protein, partial [Stenotrophobium sp.]